ncbi:hypothetical protein [Pseudomonas profundi]|uniref:hypothetical protein n=1 Tax=Pseudomonas profundi TaxID=1981513 RepID=UPI0012392519|nr:hypothetical protein [Pseudomonas profundi]
MKSTTLLATAVLLVSPAIHANQSPDSCENNMQELEGLEATDLNYLGDAAEKQIQDHIRQAKAAQEAGDMDACFIHSSKALREIRGVGEEEGMEPNTSENSQDQ